jgi:phosphatidylserine/phosphatidylglycerophosphate/cardiolipin synthase-like enzyme
MRKYITIFITIFIVFILSSSGCNPFEDPGISNDPPIRIYFSEPGSDLNTGRNKNIDKVAIDLIEQAEQKIEIAVYNFNHVGILKALLSAKKRGIQLRFVGDIEEANSSAYKEILKSGVEYSLGNLNGIQHNKFLLIDEIFLFTGTGNFTEQGFLYNDNNFILIKDKKIAKHYTFEFEQMFNGSYGKSKVPFRLKNTFKLDNIKINIYFSPYDGENAINAMINSIDKAEESIYYMIYAFTHDEMASALIRAVNRGVVVKGIHDSGFLSGTSAEAFRLHSSAFDNKYGFDINGPYVFRDGNENKIEINKSYHGGKLHCKTLIIDPNSDRAVAYTGSFNWSGNAINSNDENLIEIRSKTVAQSLIRQWRKMHHLSYYLGGENFKENENGWSYINGSTAEMGDIIISEVNWAGIFAARTGEHVKNADFIEIKNRSNKTINLSHWVLQWGIDERQNHFPIPDLNNTYPDYEQSNSNNLSGITNTDKNHMVLYSDPFFADSAFTNENPEFDFNISGDAANAKYIIKISGTKEFKINKNSFKLRLYDKKMNLIDEAGDGGPVFYGNQADVTMPFNSSMERYDRNVWDNRKELNGANRGNLKSSWYQTELPQLSSSVLLTGVGIIDELSTTIPITSGNAGWNTSCFPGFNYALLIDKNNSYLIQYNNFKSVTNALENVKILYGESNISFDQNPLSEYYTDTRVKCFASTVTGAAVYKASSNEFSFINSADGYYFPDPENKNPNTADYFSGIRLTENYSAIVSQVDSLSSIEREPHIITYGKKLTNKGLGEISCSACKDNAEYIIHYIGPLNNKASIDYIYFNRMTPLRINSKTPPPELDSLKVIDEKSISIIYNQEVNKNDALDSSNYCLNTGAECISSLELNIVQDLQDDARYNILIENKLVYENSYIFSIINQIRDLNDRPLNSAAYYFSGFYPARAEVIFSEIGPEHSESRSDFIKLTVRDAGSIQGLRIFRFRSQDPELLYEFNAIFLPSGDSIVLHLNDNNACETSEDKIQSFNKNACDEALYSTADNNIWDVYSTIENGLSNSEDAILLSYGDFENPEPADFACYSRKDGVFSKTMIDEVIRKIYVMHTGLWHFSEKPVYGYNKVAVQNPV